MIYGEFGIMVKHGGMTNMVKNVKIRNIVKNGEIKNMTNFNVTADLSSFAGFSTLGGTLEQSIRHHLPPALETRQKVEGESRFGGRDELNLTSKT